VTTSYSPFSAQAYGLTGDMPAASTVDTSPSIAQSAVTGLAPFWHPDNPVFWVGVVAAAACGLIGFTVSGRAGPVHGSAGVGAT
jgi:hypothetical protein